jgi:hypothetical protein
MAKFEIRRNTNDEYYWRLIANNGQIICWSEGYTRKQNAEDSIAFVKANAANAPIV